MASDEPIPLTASDAENIRAVMAMMAIARSRVKRRHGNPAPFYIAAGEHLDRLRRDKPQAIWAEIVSTHCGISRRRAYELVALARGKSLAAIRAEKAASMRRSRAKHVVHKPQGAKNG